MWAVANGAAILQCFMAEYIVVALSHVAFSAGFLRRLDIHPSSIDSVAFVRIVTISAAHPTIGDGMAMRQIKGSPRIEVTLEASFRRFLGVDDRVGQASAFRVDAPRSVTSFAAKIKRIIPGSKQPGMRGPFETVHYFTVTFATPGDPDKFCTLDMRWHHDDVVDRHAGSKGDRR